MNNEINNMPENNFNNNQQNNQEKIEIPQKYYEQKQELAAQRQAEEEQKRIQLEEQKLNSHEKQSIIQPLVCGLVIILGYYTASIFKNFLPLIIIPVYLIVAGISNINKHHQNSSFPTSILFGGLLDAILCFVLSFIYENAFDTLFNYTILCTATGIIGFITLSIIKKIITNRSSIKALETIGILVFFVFLIGGPYYAIKNHYSLVAEYVLNIKNVIEATTEKDFIIQTLEFRYNTTFICDQDLNDSSINSINYAIDTNKRTVNTRWCMDNNNNAFKVRSTEFNKGNVEYIVEDDYLKVLHFSKIIDDINTSLNTKINATNIMISFYPEKGCTIIGDCTDVDEYISHKEELISYENRYNLSRESNFSKYINMDTKEFINSQKFKYKIIAIGNYSSSSDNDQIINEILNTLNNQGYKNTYGYQISLAKPSDAYYEILYTVKGDANKDQTFTNPIFVK